MCDSDEQIGVLRPVFLGELIPYYPPVPFVTGGMLRVPALPISTMSVL